MRYGAVFNSQAPHKHSKITQQRHLLLHQLLLILKTTLTSSQHAPGVGIMFCRQLRHACGTLMHFLCRLRDGQWYNFSVQEAAGSWL